MVLTFAQHVHKASPNNTNLILSPFSVQAALGLALLGASGKTFEELRAGLKLNDIADPGLAEVDQRLVIANAFQHQLATITNNPMLRVANKIYVQQSYHIKPAFAQLAKEQFASETETLDFGDAAASAAAINAWVEQKTNHLIKDLIDASSVSVYTRMILVNAIHFKGQWQHKFPVDGTIKAPFYTSETDSVEVDTMHVKDRFRYGEWEELDATALELPYKDSDMSMLIVLPNQRTGLGELVAKLKDADLAELTTKMYRTEVSVALPKFKIEHEVKLPAVLKEVSALRLAFSRVGKY